MKVHHRDGEYIKCITVKESASVYKLECTIVNYAFKV